MKHIDLQAIQIIFLVEDCENSPGKIYAIFTTEDEANAFADAMENKETTKCDVVERSLFAGPAFHLGFNE